MLLAIEQLANKKIILAICSAHAKQFIDPRTLPNPHVRNNVWQTDNWTPHHTINKLWFFMGSKMRVSIMRSALVFFDAWFAAARDRSLIRIAFGIAYTLTHDLNMSTCVYKYDPIVLCLRYMIFYIVTKKRSACLARPEPCVQCRTCTTCAH